MWLFVFFPSFYSFICFCSTFSRTTLTSTKPAHSMSFNQFTEQIFDDTIIDNRITAINAKDMKNHHEFLYPYNLTVFRVIPTLDNTRHTTGTDVDKFENSKSDNLVSLSLSSAPFHFAIETKLHFWIQRIVI